MSSKNLVILGDSYISDKIDFHGANLFHIGRRRDDLSVCRSYLLTLEDKFDVTEYDNADKQILAFCRQIEQEFGPIDSVIANTEHTLLAGGKLRDALVIAGRNCAQLLPFRDKAVMQQAVAATGLVKTKAFVSHQVLAQSKLEDVVAETFQTTFPLVIKPCSQAGSRMVYFVDDLPTLKGHIEEFLQQEVEFVIEEYIADPIVHIDGVFRDGQMQFVTAFKYINDCISWHKKGSTMSSVLIDDDAMRAKIISFAQGVLQSIGTPDAVFHLEAFLSDSGELTFLEIGARPGGAAIAPCIKVFYDVDMLLEGLNVELGLPANIVNRGFLEPVHKAANAAWTVLPLLEREYCQIEQVNGLSQLPDSVAWFEHIQVGDVFNQHYFEDPAIGKFVVTQTQLAHVLRDINTIESLFSVTTSRLPAEV